MAAKAQQSAPEPVDLDLDAELGEIDLSPVPVRLAGEVWRVRRDLSVAEVRQFWEHAATKDDAACLGILLGDKTRGAKLNTVLEELPHQRQKLALRRLMATAGLLDATGEQAGEAQAS